MMTNPNKVAKTYLESQSISARAVGWPRLVGTAPGIGGSGSELSLSEPEWHSAPTH